MAYRAKAKKIAEAVRRSINRLDLNAESSTAGRFYSMEACYGTKVQTRLAFVESAERSSDFREFYRTKFAIERSGSVRAAVTEGVY